MDRFEIGQLVKVISNVDNYEEYGIVIELVRSIRQPIKVEFSDGNWCMYDMNELKIVNFKDETDN